ncbi:hypothetical protein GCM10022221_63140 [Actinocorallia aurea]
MVVARYAEQCLKANDHNRPTPVVDAPCHPLADPRTFTCKGFLDGRPWMSEATVTPPVPAGQSRRGPDGPPAPRRFTRGATGDGRMSRSLRTLMIAREGSW